MQTPRYASRFAAISAEPEKVIVTGSIKFDSLGQLASSKRISQLKQLAGITDGDVVWLAGSTQENEDILAIQTFANLKEDFPQLKLILVPRHPRRCHRLMKIAANNGVDFQLRSTMRKPTSGGSIQPRLTIVDVIGELRDWWGCADIGYVGGSMGSRGGQNMIEPAAYGVPISFGPHTENFQSVVEMLIGSHSAKVVQNQAEMQAFVAQCLRYPESAERMGRRAQLTVNQQKGAVSRTIDALRPLIPALADEDAATHLPRGMTDAA